MVFHSDLFTVIKPSSATPSARRALALPGFSDKSGLPIFTRTLQMEGAKWPLDAPALPKPNFGRDFSLLYEPQ